MKFIAFFMVGLLVETSGAAVTDMPAFPGLVEIESTYTDDATGKPVTVTGAGFIVAYEGHHFVVTASHVSQGGIQFGIDKPSLVVRGYDQSLGKMVVLDAQIRYAANLWDTEIMLIHPRHQLMPFARYRPSEDPDLDPKLHPHGFIELEERVVDALRQTDFIANPGYYPVGIYAGVPLLPAVAEKLPTSHTFSDLTSQELSWLVDKAQSPRFKRRVELGFKEQVFEVRTHTKFPKGMSGSPLVAFYQDKAWMMGHVSGYALHFNMGWTIHPRFVTARLMRQFLDYLGHARVIRQWNLTEKIYWHMQDGVIHRRGNLAALNFRYSEVVPNAAQGNRGEAGGTRDDSGGGLFDEERILDGVLIKPIDSEPLEIRALVLESEYFSPPALLPADANGLHHALNYLTSAGKSGPKTWMRSLTGRAQLVARIKETLTRKFGPRPDATWRFHLTAERLTPVDKHTVWQSNQLTVEVTENDQRVNLHLVSEFIEWAHSICDQPDNSCGRFRPVVLLEHGNDKYAFPVGQILMDDPGHSVFYQPGQRLEFTVSSQSGEEVVFYEDNVD